MKIFCFLRPIAYLCDLQQTVIHMNKIYLLITLLLASLHVSDAVAQRNRARAKKKPKTTLSPEEQKHQERIQQMMETIQDVVFIDSQVVDKQNLLRALRLNPDAGSIHYYNKFFKTNSQPEAFVNVNEMGEKCYYALERSDSTMAIYTSDMIGNKWSQPELMGGLDLSVYQRANYPFMMSDGTTFYFAAKGEESIGGYDIFVTRYDAEAKEFLTPENIGMPFNSTANDYLMAIDDIEKIGWFVTDRNLPDGKVCVYTFIPNEQRQVYDASTIPEDKLKRLATIASIADTWGNGKERNKALERLAKTDQRRESRQENDTEKKLTDDEDIYEDYGIRRNHFIVDNTTVYTNPSDFKGAVSYQEFDMLVDRTEILIQKRRLLALMREVFAKADMGRKSSLKKELFEQEQEVEALEREVQAKAKELRNKEILSRSKR